MPELPEVERAAQLMKQNAQGRVIERVETVEDNIVFSGDSNKQFEDEITGRKVKNVARYGKVFYVELDGEGKMPVLHFGMTGNIHIKGQTPIYYKEGPRKGDEEWPPRFMKFILHLSAIESSPATQIAFVDARRLGRIRLCKSPLSELPISALGFDPILSMPPLEEFSESVLKRSCPIKALLLDQTFSAGVGNWVADEILYHARVHPEQRCDSLSQDQISSLHEHTAGICRTAVDVNADASKFPEHWLFKHRWGKGKKAKKGKEFDGLKLPSGDPATIKWLKVGGRTSAFVAELQHLVGNTTGRSKAKSKVRSKSQDDTVSGQSELSALSDDEAEETVAPAPRKRRGTQVCTLVVL
ncbi:AtMMH-1 [Rickenella mellea]|uniref:AtMMH-1 n=1 Tax=Rickenella mellea TaxID=50990 RepID=A0A4Y7QP51_9AGAM|nr:AtMMH-1 [Rickenella mellea]